MKNMKLRYKRTFQVEKFFELFEERQRVFDWDHYAERFKEHPGYGEHSKGRDFQIEIYAGSFLAFHRIGAIEDINVKNPELDISLIENINSDRYILGRDFCGRNFIYSLRGEPKVKCDNLLSVLGTKTLINFWYREFPKPNREKSDLIINLLGENIAYGIVTTRDNLGRYSKNFEKRGGFALSLPFDRVKLKEIVWETCKRHGLGIMEERV